MFSEDVRCLSVREWRAVVYGNDQQSKADGLDVCGVDRLVSDDELTEIVDSLNDVDDPMLREKYWLLR